jgi:hypothetical protein
VCGLGYGCGTVRVGHVMGRRAARAIAGDESCRACPDCRCLRRQRAGSRGGQRQQPIPSPPPTSGNPSADCVGIIVDAAEFALWLSPHILGNIRRILEDLFKWEMTQADAYAAVISEAAEHSGGGLLAEVPRTVHDCPDLKTTWSWTLPPKSEPCSSCPTRRTCCRCLPGAAHRSSPPLRSLPRSMPCDATRGEGGAETAIRQGLCRPLP